MSSDAASPQISPVLAQAPATRVGRRESPLAMLPGLGVVGLIGAAVFLSLSHGRAARAQMAHRPPMMQPAPPQPPAGPAPPASIWTRPDEPAPPPQPGVSAAAADDQAHLRAPAMVVDIAEAAPPPAPMAAAARPAVAGNTITVTGSGADAKALSAEERFAERVGSGEVETARAGRLRDLALTAPQGTVIPAVLETAISSDLPGFVRAVVSRDVRGFDGSTVLIPRGSKLIGQYKNAVAVGQTRAFVVWTRVITPQGITVDLASPSADPLGRGGVPGETNNHFLRRFGASILLSVLSSGLDALGRGGSQNNTAIVIGSPQQASSVASIALSKEIDIPATIEVKQGVPIQVFVARDLDFTGVMAAAR